ncbi:hypothetical protein J2W25_001987 [Variovorax boronicumulans]|uniref:Uncharacterized protein n=1 Tax=Variovorax boronicumulans TaxID=436515 RepID=A0AAW8DUP5_9BURK|nr:hypothetical protein [Variovorax boronicumulans]MDP9877682.1 hypothetical protein [Variovorax boronicumulans]MDP9922966.1 hypothetical protein [Variovorax boronicumulans]
MAAWPNGSVSKRKHRDLSRAPGVPMRDNRMSLGERGDGIRHDSCHDDALTCTRLLKAQFLHGKPRSCAMQAPMISPHATAASVRKRRRSLKTAITVIAFGIALVLIAALPPSAPAESPSDISAAAPQV